MKKQKNILNERPRKKNNKKMIDKWELDLNDTFKVSVDVSDEKQDPYITDMKKEFVRLNIGLCEKPEPMSKVQAFIIIALTLLAFVVLFKGAQHAVDVHALNTCEQYGDCAEVIRDINAH